MTGCASYPVGASKAEVWTARYEQNIIQDDDTGGEIAWKCTKHALWDIFTICFAEIYYARVRSNYGYWLGIERQKQMQIESELAADKKFQEYLEKYRGKAVQEILMKFGPSDKITGDGAGGKIYSYEQSWDVIERKLSLNFWSVGVAGGASGTAKGSIERIRYIYWFNVNEAGTVYGSGTSKR